jgi:hypothetical protein
VLARRDDITTIRTEHLPIVSKIRFHRLVWFAETQTVVPSAMSVSIPITEEKGSKI